MIEMRLMDPNKHMPQMRLFQDSCMQVDIIRAFAVPTISVERATKLFPTKGVVGFFQKI